MIIRAKDFSSRTAIDSYVVRELGTDVSQNKIAGHTIEGSQEELSNVGLSGETTVYGVKCKVV